MKNLIGLIILAIIGIATYLLVFNKDSNSVANKEDFKDFAIKDTLAINKIFMSQPNGKKLLLTKQTNDTWLVNNDFEARTDAIELILKTVKDIKVKGIVAKDDMVHTIKRLATGSTKVEFYTGNSKPEKTWYVGDPTVNKLGTYMLLEKGGVKSSKPYVTHMMMEKGFLGSRFFLDSFLWKERVLAKCDPKEIKSIEVTHSDNTSISFKMQQYEFGKFNVTNLNDGETSELSSNVAVPYFKEFETIYYEYVDKKTNIELLDSIYSVLPRHIVKVELNNDEGFLIKTYNMPVREGASVDGIEMTYHPERMYAYSSYLGKENHAIVQNLTFDELVPSYDMLKSSTTVEK